MGIQGLDNLDIYGDDSAKQEEETKKTIKVKTPEELEAEYIFDKTYTCPVCDKSFKSKTMKSNKAKLISTDMDLRPVHQNVDVVKYDVVACPCCGYAVLARYFAPLTTMQIKKIKESISKNYKIQDEKKSKIYSYDEAIERGKLALLSSVIKGAKDSEKAYVCLKTAWLFRGKAEHLPETEEDDIKRCQREEEAFLQKAYDGLVSARQKELFPICGMDELTFDYVLAALAHRLGHLEVSARLVGEILTKPTANRRIKEKTGVLKEVLKKDIQQKKQQGQ